MLSTYLVSKDMIGLTISTTYTITNSLLNNNKYNYFSFIENTDIITRIQVIHQFIEDIMDDSRCQKNKSILLCIENIENSIKDINNILEKINNNYMSYKKSWFHYFYRFNCDKDIIELKHKIKILNDRNEVLLKFRMALW